MRDMPMFTTENGIASLTLREIPYRKTAYVRIQDTLAPEALLQECCDFCRAVGAETVCATGHRILETYPVHTEIWRMNCLRSTLPDTDAALFPVQQKTLEQWRTIYNEKMQNVPNARYMTTIDAIDLLAKGNGYFIHRDNSLLGIGIASGDSVDAIASLVPGAGKDVLLSLNYALSADQIKLEVASKNQKAIRLYDKLGFVKTERIEIWYQII